jgi:hypothetical protein
MPIINRTDPSTIDKIVDLIEESNSTFTAAAAIYAGLCFLGRNPCHDIGRALEAIVDKSEAELDPEIVRDMIHGLTHVARAFEPMVRKRMGHEAVDVAVVVLKEEGETAADKLLDSNVPMFCGKRDEEGCQVIVVSTDGSKASLPDRLDIANHSPTGFEWGYEGSGPAQLAIAMLAYVSDEDTARKHHQAFKREFVATLPKETPWVMGLHSVKQWIANQAG